MSHAVKFQRTPFFIITEYEMQGSVAYHNNSSCSSSDLHNNSNTRLLESGMSPSKSRYFRRITKTKNKLKHLCHECG
jgi:hypothetical protein